MGEADSALRQEIEKVRERARLQGLSQGLGPEAAAHQGNVAVEEFCARWGIRPEMVGAAAPHGGRPGGATGQPFREEPRKVDLGASPMRTGAVPGQTQAIRIADLLKRAKEADTSAAKPAAPAPAAAAPPRTGSNLSALLQRMRAPDAAGPAATRAPAPPPASPPPSPPRPAPAQGTVLRAVSTGEPLGGGATLAANAERRRQVLDEFDRTYAEVQTMLEQRIGVVDIALNDASKGITGAMATAQAGGLRPDQVTVLAADVDRLRQHLTVMMQVCDEFLRHMEQVQGHRPEGR